MLPGVQHYLDNLIVYRNRIEMLVHAGIAARSVILRVHHGMHRNGFLASRVAGLVNWWRRIRQPPFSA